MTQVRAKVTNPDGSAAGNTPIRFELVGTDSGFITADNETIQPVQDIVTDSVGAYLIDLPSNVGINPAGTKWRRHVKGVKPFYNDLIVPVSGGPYYEELILAEALPPVPAADPSTEVDRAEITADTAPLAVNGLAAAAVPLLVVDIPNLSKPVILEGAVRIISSVANASVFAAFSPVGGDLSTCRGPYWANIGPTASSSMATCAPKHRLPPNSPGSWQLFVGADNAMNLTVKAQTQGIGYVSAETR